MSIQYFLNLIAGDPTMYLDEDTFISSLKNIPDLNADANGYTLFHYSAFYNRHKIAKFLINLGVDVNVKTNIEQKNALHMAIDGYADPEMIKLLLSVGVDATCQNINGKTPLHLAVLDTRHNINLEENIKLLLQQSNINLVDNEGHTVLDAAVLANRIDIAKLIDIKYTEQCVQLVKTIIETPK